MAFDARPILEKMDSNQLPRDVAITFKHRRRACLLVGRYYINGRANGERGNNIINKASELGLMLFFLIVETLWGRFLIFPVSHKSRYGFKDCLNGGTKLKVAIFAIGGR